MKKISEPIVFFGSGPVAAASLEFLQEHFNLEAVITKPRPAHHRGAVPVIDLAEGRHLPLLYAQDQAELSQLFDNHQFEARLGIIIDFGIIIPDAIIQAFPLGIVNSHFSLLPEWRGADPITFSILSGQQTTGVSLMLIVAAMDEGPILGQAEYQLPQGITTPDLTKQLIELSNQLISQQLPRYLAGELQTRPQDTSAVKPSYSRRLTKDDGVLDWRKPAAQLEREIRAFMEWPKSRTAFDNLEIVITSAHVVDNSGRPGTRLVIDKLPVVACGQQSLAIDKLKPAGKPEMTGQAFLAGYKQLFST